jgi:hypothetical protein
MKMSATIVEINIIRLMRTRLAFLLRDIFSASSGFRTGISFQSENAKTGAPSVALPSVALSICGAAICGAVYMWRCHLWRCLYVALRF